MSKIALILVLVFAVIVLTTQAVHGATTKTPVRRSYEQAHRAAVKYRHQRDDLQQRLTRRVLEVRRLRYMLSKRVVPDAATAIRLVFGPYGEQAVRVSSCETGGTFDVHAQNGQYLGLFQMGSYARGKYGHAYTALEQAKAAYRYFVDSGKDWSPWECRP